MYPGQKRVKYIYPFGMPLSTSLFADIVSLSFVRLRQDRGQGLRFIIWLQPKFMTANSSAVVNLKALSAGSTCRAVSLVSRQLRRCTNFLSSRN